MILVVVAVLVARIRQDEVFKTRLKTSATLKLLIVNTVIYLVLSLPCLFLALPDSMLDILGTSYGYTIAGHQYYRLVSSMFTHASLDHLASNMISLTGLGLILEIMIGKKKMLTCYFASGLVGGLIATLIHGIILTDNVISVGASGAICGLIGCVLALLLSSRKKADFLNLLVIALLPMVFSMLDPTSGVDNVCHACGIVIGFACGALFSRGKSKSGFSC
jgi:rhomboid protease GluP